MTAATTASTPSRRRGAPEPSKQQQTRSVRILLRPGNYVLKQAFHVRAAPGVVISLETVRMPKNVFRPKPAVAGHGDGGSGAPLLMEQALPLDAAATASLSVSSSPPKPSFRNLFRCSRQESGEGESETEDATDFDDWLQASSENGGADAVPQHATLMLRSRRHNEPVFRVSQGVLRLTDLEIQHNSHGLDIWNGNAAVQVQPPQIEEETGGAPWPAHLPRPVAVLEGVKVTSRSGRGVVNIDGGRVIVRRCAVTDCAATGVYIGGPGSSAYISETDVLRNGVGNARGGRRGIARGHSGVYLEQGVARIEQSNVSHNTLTGVSVVSPDNAAVHLEDSTLLSNGTYQLELPPPGSASRRRCVTERNVLAATGDGELRSGLLGAAEPPRPPPAGTAGALLPLLLPPPPMPFLGHN